MKAEIICTGAELLSGKTINTNAAYLSKELSAIGIEVAYHTVVGDNEKELYESIDTCTKRADILIITGGLGATYDDLTKETAARYFKREMIFDKISYDNIVSYFEYTKREISENNKKQAYIPEGSIALKNERGTAPGIILKEKDKTVILLPGPPYEMQHMFLKYVKKYLVDLSGNVIISKDINFFGISEAALEYRLRSLMISSKNPVIAPYAKKGEVVIRVSARAENKEKAEEILNPVTEKICKEFSDYIYATDALNLESVLVEKLTQANKKVAVAESCTGGLVSKRITDISGASKVFECEICSYSDRIKESILGVKRETLEKYTAVSKETAAEMAIGIKRLTGADIAVSVTGVAGPGDLSVDKPYGLVYIGIKSEKYSDVLELKLGGNDKSDRELIRNLAASYAINACLRAI